MHQLTDHEIDERTDDRIHASGETPEIVSDRVLATGPDRHVAIIGRFIRHLDFSSIVWNL